MHRLLRPRHSRAEIWRAADSADVAATPRLAGQQRQPRYATAMAHQILPAQDSAPYAVPPPFLPTEKYCHHHPNMRGRMPQGVLLQIRIRIRIQAPLSCANCRPAETTAASNEPPVDISAEEGEEEEEEEVPLARVGTRTIRCDAVGRETEATALSCSRQRSMPSRGVQDRTRYHSTPYRALLVAISHSFSFVTCRIASYTCIQTFHFSCLSL